LMFASHSLT